MIDAETDFTGTAPAEGADALDADRLATWMEANVAGFAGPLTVAKFKGGQSNPTYRLDTPGRAYVLRRKPFGPLLPSAHAVDREHRLIAALHPTGFPVAEPFGLCADEGVIGSAFYVMALVEGRTFWNGAMPDADPALRRATYDAMVDTLAALHAIDPAAVGLGDYGRPGNYFGRQIERWTKQYRLAETGPVPAMDRLIDWLPRGVPAQDRVAIVHGDYRIDNLICDPATGQVRAVLDWELSTLGDPLADFTYFALAWVTANDGRSGLADVDRAALGIPELDEVVARYCAATGRDGVPALDWYFAYNQFRLASILQGIAKRVEIGTATSARARDMAAMVGPLAEQAWGFAVKAGA